MGDLHHFAERATQTKRQDVRMTDWLKSNFSLGNVITILVIVAALVASGARAEYINGQQERELMDIEMRLREHVSKTSIHIDPDRDGRNWVELMERLRRIEAKIDDRR